MTEIFFYSGVTDKLNVVCRLSAKALSQEAKIMIYATERSTLETIDKLLWTYQQTSFLPHCFIDDDKKLVASTPIILSNRVTSGHDFNVLINMSNQCPQDFDQFERVIEISSVHQEDKLSARDRYRSYKQAGYTLHHHDLTKH